MSSFKDDTYTSLFSTAKSKLNNMLKVMDPDPTMTTTDWLNVSGGVVFGLTSVFLLLSFTLFGKPHLRNKLVTPTTIWLVFSGVIHTWIEGSFVFDRSTSWIKASLNYYASGDFRYGNPMEAGTAAMETITSVFEGPLCWLVAYGVIHNKPWRHPAQLVLTTMQIYGLVWFTLHPLFTAEGYAGHVSRDPFLFWVIVVGMNAPWGIIPPLLWLQSVRRITEALTPQGRTLASDPPRATPSQRPHASMSTSSGETLLSSTTIKPLIPEQRGRKKTQ